MKIHLYGHYDHCALCNLHGSAAEKTAFYKDAPFFPPAAVSFSLVAACALLWQKAGNFGSRF